MSVSTQRMEEYSQAAVDVSGASGNSQTFDLGDHREAVFVAHLTALSGGTSPDVTFTVEDSPDGTNWDEVHAFSARSATGRDVHRTSAPLQRRARISWATTGGPTTATATFTLVAKG